MQFRVPQNIDLEDKLIGPLTLVQFLYLLVGGMTDYVLLQTVFPVYPIVFVVIALPVAVLACSFAFLKINDLPFPKFIKATILFLFSDKKRVWHKSTSLDDQIKLIEPKKKIEKKMLKTQIEKSEIEQMAQVLDTAGWAAVRDEHLKEFVSTFQDHHPLEEAQVKPTKSDPKATATPPNIPGTKPNLNKLK